MNPKRILTYAALFSIPVFVALTHGKMSTALFFFLLRTFNLSLFTSYQIQFVIIGIAAILCAFLIMRFALKKWCIAIIVLLFAGISLLRMRYLFYENHDHADYSEIKNLPDCMKESNYDTFWEYLNQGCHLTLGELIRAICYKSAIWIGVFFLIYFLAYWIRRSKKKANAQLIDRE